MWGRGCVPAIYSKNGATHHPITPPPTYPAARDADNVGPPIIFLQPITIVTLDFFGISEKNMVFNVVHYYCNARLVLERALLMVKKREKQ